MIILSGPNANCCDILFALHLELVVLERVGCTESKGNPEKMGRGDS